MIMPDPKSIRFLLSRYADLRIRCAERETQETLRALEDVSYTLCVSTGTATVREALAAADAMLAQGHADTSPRTPLAA